MSKEHQSKDSLKTSKPLILGVGNLLLSDDGVGVHIIKRLHKEEINADLLDVGMGGFDILERILGYKKVIIIDSIITGAEPGTIYRFTPEDLTNFPALSHTHSIDLPTSLKLGQQLMADEMPDDIVIYAIEAEDITTFNEDCTPKVKAAIPKVIKQIKDDLKSFEKLEC
jgi:hydrogenase maturation protease